MKVLVERQNIVPLHLAFYQQKRELEDLGHELINIDEWLIDTAHTTKKCWYGDSMPGIITLMNPGQRIRLVHAGVRHGFIPGVHLTYKAASRTGDYHNEMDGSNFTR